MVQWADDLENDNLPSDPHSVMTHCFTRKHDGETFTNEKEKKISDRYKAVIVKITQTQTESRSSQVDPKSVYKQVAIEPGGVGHGRIFETGSASSVLYGDVNEFGPAQQTTQLPLEYVEQIANLKEETMALKENEKVLEEGLRIQSMQISYMSQYLPPPQQQQHMPGLGSQGGFMHSPWMNFTQLIGSQQPLQFPQFSQGAAAGPMYGQAPAAVPIFTNNVAADTGPMYTQPPSAPIAPQPQFQQPCSVMPNATMSRANNFDSQAVEDLARDFAEA